ncbi:MAG TPA: LapA family protein [Burkholderiales bacterium]|nr:LapA family protein [Burkholderiales bacterium]
MRIVTWTIRLVLLVLLIALAAKNTEPVTLRFYFDLALQTPLIVAIFGAFLVGALFGVLALLATVLRHKREIASLRRRAARLEASSAASAQGTGAAPAAGEASAGTLAPPPLPPI